LNDGDTVALSAAGDAEMKDGLRVKLQRP